MLREDPAPGSGLEPLSNPASDTSSDNDSVMPELTNSSGENSDSESVMPELTDSSEDEFEIQANDSSEDEFDIRANCLRLPFAPDEFDIRWWFHGGYWQ